MRERTPLPGSLVTLRLPPEQLPDEPEPLDHRLSLLPERSRRALLAGLDASAPYHLYATSTAEIAFEDDLLRIAESFAASSSGVDLVCAPNPADPFEPLVAELPAGQGASLRDAEERALRSLARRLAALPRTEALRSADRSLGRDLDARTREAIATLEIQARDLGFGVRTGNGLLQTFPILHGKPVSSEQLSVLDEATRKGILESEEKLSEAVDAATAQIRALTEQSEVARDEAAQRGAEELITEELALLRSEFAATPEAIELIEMLAEDLRSGWRDLLPSGHPLRPGDGEPRRFGLHLLLASAPEGRPHVELLLAPSARELFGSLPVRSVRGVLHADFSSLRPGALVRCSQGVLLLRALDLLRQPDLWPRLRRALLTHQLDLEGPPGCPISPQPIPLSTRVILIGPSDLHDQLASEDPDFLTIFPLKVEVEPVIDRTDEAVRSLDSFLVSHGRSLGWPPFDRPARARLIDLATRLAEDRHRLSLSLRPLDETASLAADAVRRDERSTITADDIDAAWNDRRARSAGAATHALQQFTEGVVLIDTDGRRVGVVNGLAVFCTADQCFGQPMRLTAVVSPGTEGVIDVEREAHLGGDVHTKGVAILRGLLSFLFGQERPLSLRAQITFEQSYGEVDGDSASSAEFFAILSALADVPVDQGLAVTGSVNQIGQIQAIGGVCEKIEGFFDLCAARGLTGHQGVILPRANLRHLVLRDDVAQAIAEKRFLLHAIDDVRHGIEILTGADAGERDTEGKFPAASLFGRAERRIIELAERLHSANTHPLDPLGHDADLADADAAMRGR